MKPSRTDSPETDNYQRLLRDYEDFVYLVSHDLRAPLRHIEGFSRILLKRHEDTFDDKSRRDFNFVIDGVERCKAILDALQALARLIPTTEQPVDTMAVVASALLQLQPRLAATDAEIRYQALPALRGDPALFETLFMVILDNALRYTRPDARPQIQITAEQLPEHIRFCVSDNGAGIAAAHVENVFRMFHRGGRRDGAPGEGTGLTRARRIVQLYHGQIWIESSGPTGTTLCFTLGEPVSR